MRLGCTKGSSSFRLLLLQILIEKRGDRRDQLLHLSVARHRNMVAALDYDHTRAWNQSRELATRFQWHDLIPASVND